jgi:hypothetical protein
LAGRFESKSSIPSTCGRICFLCQRLRPIGKTARASACPPCRPVGGGVLRVSAYFLKTLGKARTAWRVALHPLVVTVAQTLLGTLVETSIMHIVVWINSQESFRCVRRVSPQHISGGGEMSRQPRKAR